MLKKSILRVFHTWDGTTDPQPDRVSHNEYQLTTHFGIFWLTHIEDYLIGVSAYVRRSSTLTRNVNIHQNASSLGSAQFSGFPSLIPGGP
jgi:hypothetical protein